MPTDPIKHSIPFEFTGNAREYFSIWIVNVLLTILTLGIYSAWAKVRTHQYFYGNTLLSGNSFRYLATPIQILKGRALAVTFFLAYYFSGLISPIATGGIILILAALAPALIVMSMSFQLRNASYRNIQFNFKKDYRKAYAIFIYPLLIIVPYFLLIAYFQSDFQIDDFNLEDKGNLSTLTILISILPLLIAAYLPLWQYMIIKFKASHARFGTAHFSFSGSAKQLYGIYFKAGFGVMMLGLIATAIIVGLGALLNSSELSSSLEPFAPMLIILVIPPLYLWMFAYLHTKKINFIFGQLQLNGLHIQSELKVSYIMYLYVTNTLAMIISLGLLMPWAKIRSARYRAKMTSVLTSENLDTFIGAQTEKQAAFGEEMGDAFDMDLGF